MAMHLCIFFFLFLNEKKSSITKNKSNALPCIHFIVTAKKEKSLI